MKLTLATRKSPLALAQTNMVAARFKETLGAECELMKIVTTGDRQTDWSLIKQGGKGLFTAELEQALLRGEAQVAVHSCKDLPGENPAGLTVAGFLPREMTNDVLVLREGVMVPDTIGTSSPRRQLQIARMFPGARFTEIRGNVDTRLKKIAGGDADATILAAAGMRRLDIHSWPGIILRPLAFDESVPAVGQGAIAIQCTDALAPQLAPALDATTFRNVSLERAFQALVGAGCQTAFAAHSTGDTLYFFHERTGIRSFPLRDADFVAPRETAAHILKELGFNV